MLMMVVWCRVDDKSRGRTVKFERQLVADRQRYVKQASVLLSKRAELRRLSDVISRRHKVITRGGGLKYTHF